MRMPSHRSELRSVRALTGVLGAFVLAVTLGGCTTFQAAATDRGNLAAAAPIPENRWPARKTDDLVEKAQRSPREYLARLMQGSSGLARMAHSDRTMRGPGGASFTSGVYGRGILRVYELRGGDSGSVGRGVLGMRFYSFTEQSDRPSDLRVTEYAQKQFTALNKRLADSGATLTPEDAEFLRVMSEGTSVRVVEPPRDREVRGTIVYMAGLGSAEYEQPLIDELIRRGWWIVKVATPRVWWYESKPWMIASRADIPQVAKKLAGVMDDLVAEPAYATEAAIAYLREHRPDIPLSPLVMVGCSAGSLAAPAVVARLPESFSAAVLVGSGANLLEISQKSDLTDGGIHLAWPDNQPVGPWRTELFHQYLTYSTLDPYHTARFLRNKPTLLVQANLDLTVPASNGWLLWERLGRPDRYVHVGEHRTLFLTLKGQSQRVADWLEAQMAKLPGHEPVVRTIPDPQAKPEAATTH